jgi:cytoplasmic iron level regulating protein YaaA (DUF328/UPF0246 family)
MMEKTGILIITICSNNKRQGGRPFVKGILSLLTALPEHAPTIIKKRQTILHLLKEGGAIRDGVEISRMQLNSRLKLGPDFGGDESSLYMPAYERYIGRFFVEVGKDNPCILAETVHHVLILSGPYGILLPEEQIQAYSCHVDDHPQISETWKDAAFLTSLVLAYINKYSIKRVLDLTGQESYRNLIDWDRIAKKINTIHFFSEQYTGASALLSLGELARTRLLTKTEDEILAIDPRDPIYLDDHGRIVVTPLPIPPDGLPKESGAAVHMNLEEEDSEDEAALGILDGASGILGHARDIPITSGEHNTIFDKRIAQIGDLPIEVQDIILPISRCPDVLEVFLGRFSSSGHNRRVFTLKVSAPQLDSGHIFGKLEGPGAIGRRQEVDIRVTKGREAVAYTMISDLLTGHVTVRSGTNDQHEQVLPLEKTSTPSASDFENALRSLLSTAQEEGRPYLDVVAGDLHRMVGGYPGTQHRMPSCCGVMRNAVKPGDEVLNSPRKGKGASLMIRYNLPR